MNTDTIKTALDICNLALKKLGEPSITTIDPWGTPAQRLCYRYYHPCRREVLCTNKWRFAMHTVKLSADFSTYQGHGYNLPDDCLRVWKPTPEERTIVRRVLYCSEPEITLEYLSDEEEVTKFEPIFIEAFATRLAATICSPLTVLKYY